MVFDLMMAVTVQSILEQLGGELHQAVHLKGAQVIRGIASLHQATDQDISFFSDLRLKKELRATKAAVVILKEEHKQYADRPVIVVDDPYFYYARLSKLFSKPLQPALIHETVVNEGYIHPFASVGSYTVIEKGAFISEGACVGAGCHIGENVHIGSDSKLASHVNIYSDTHVGCRVIVHSGAVIGSDGFGFAPHPQTKHWEKIHQLGSVLIEDDVEIGANTVIDRAALGQTVIGQGVKIDNQVQVAHNVAIGEHTVIAGCVGIAGSARIGKHCMIGGAAMISGHLTIADQVVIGGGTLVSRSILQAGHYAGAAPFSTHSVWTKNMAQLRHLSELAHRVKKLELELATLKLHQ